MQTWALFKPALSEVRSFSPPRYIRSPNATAKMEPLRQYRALPSPIAETEPADKPIHLSRLSTGSIPVSSAASRESGGTNPTSEFIDKDVRGGPMSSPKYHLTNDPTCWLVGTCLLHDSTLFGNPITHIKPKRGRWRRGCRSTPKS